MPIYEYRCDNDHTFEVRQSITEDALTECQVCGAPVRKVLHSPAIHFKGSGFYNTDHGTRKANKTKETSGAEKKGPDSSGSDSGASSSDGGASSGSDSGSSKSTSGDSGAKVGASSKSD
ncbi:MAG: hypothetical protein M9938_10270 [Solirubrobacterales bacterium]|nr:hypothetical protein [Solirubrobacterales bacterium]